MVIATPVESSAVSVAVWRMVEGEELTLKELIMADENEKRITLKREGREQQKEGAHDFIVKEHILKL